MMQQTNTSAPNQPRLESAANFEQDDSYFDQLQEVAETEFLRLNTSHHRSPRLYEEGRY
jgi:hypothetical protein